MRSAFTTPEMLLVLALIGVLSGVAIPHWASWRDRTLVHGAANDLAAALALARHAAVVRGERTAVRLDTSTATVFVEAVHGSRTDTLLTRPLAGVYPGVTLAATRDSIAYAASGLGWGAANTTVVARHGVATETLWVSRLGRVRR